MELQEILEITLTSPALKWKSDKEGSFKYPERFGDSVPLKVKMTKTVTPDMPMFKTSKLGIECVKDGIYFVWVNSYGAVTAILPNGERLGLRPDEFDVFEFHNQ